MQPRSEAVDMHLDAVRNNARETAEIVRVVADTISNAHDTGMITLKQGARFQLLLSFLANCSEITMVLLDGPWPIACVWPVSRILVHDALAFHQHMLAMLAADTSGLFHVEPSRYPGATQTYIVYHALRSLGMKPRFRGPRATDPGAGEQVYYKLWQFVNDRQFHEMTARNLWTDPTEYRRSANAEPTDAEVRLILARFH
jgi:hypothetical protein